MGLKDLVDDFARTRVEISRKFQQVENAKLSSNFASPNGGKAGFNDEANFAQTPSSPSSACYARLQGCHVGIGNYSSKHLEGNLKCQNAHPTVESDASRKDEQKAIS